MYVFGVTRFARLTAGLRNKAMAEPNLTLLSREIQPTTADRSRPGAASVTVDADLSAA
jgi:hypothetical protein